MFGTRTPNKRYIKHLYSTCAEKVMRFYGFNLMDKGFEGGYI